MIRYNNFSTFLKDKFGDKVGKICIDGGFTCPNRDGKCGYGGCVFCGERGAGEHIDQGLSITAQVEEYLAAHRGSPVQKYIAYFQNFTNTYADVDTLKKRYDAALIDDRIVALSVGTRPDCITEEIAALLAEYAKKLYVWVELGLQTSNDDTLRYINRLHTSEQYAQAVAILNKYGLDVVTHLMIGLPGETFEDVQNTVSFINRFDITGIKIHCLYVMEGTVLADWYREGKFTSITMEEYIKQAVYVLTHVKPSLIIHRLTGDCPKGLLVAPQWNLQKNAILDGINKMLEKDNLYQGAYYDKSI